MSDAQNLRKRNKMIKTIEESCDLYFGELLISCRSDVTYDHEEQTHDDPESWLFKYQGEVTCTVSGKSQEWVDANITDELIYAAMDGSLDDICHEGVSHLCFVIEGKS